MMVGSGINVLAQLCVLSFVDSVFLAIVTNFQTGAMLEVCLTEEELGRVGLCCHFALDCFCDNWNMV